MFDTFAAFNKVLDHPQDYNFDSALSVCNHCFWSDSYHPSSNGSQVIGKMVADQLAADGWWDSDTGLAGSGFGGILNRISL